MKKKILRVHGTLIEEAEFPIPNKIKIYRTAASEDELKIPEGKVKEVSLHHFIRSDSSPFAQKLKQKEEMFKEARELKVRPSDLDVKEYCEVSE